MKKRRISALLLITAGLLLAVGTTAWADFGGLFARLTGYQETPAVSTQGQGKFVARFDRAAGVIRYELSYAGLEGDVRMAHIHFGQPGVAGGISVFLCANMGTPPPGTQVCPPPPATISGSIGASDVIGPNDQGIAPGEFDELLSAIRAGRTYVNVHTSKHPGGEIRGQLFGGLGSGRD